MKFEIFLCYLSCCVIAMLLLCFAVFTLNFLFQKVQKSYFEGPLLNCVSVTITATNLKNLISTVLYYFFDQT